ncbi:MAG TPA: thioesterase family protein [Candidatus Eisenbacteria bacterium]|nr:thioesterase family protein [Candidatus Eisenbacteria bacterium]
MIDHPVVDLDPGVTGRQDRPVAGVDNGYVAGYRVRFDEAGADGLLRTSGLLRFAQDVAWRHSEDLGFDRRWYVERGRWWVVRAVELEVLAPIPMGRTLRTATAVVGHRRIWARRLGESRFADGTPAAVVRTDWVLLDDRGRVVRIPADFGLSFSNPELADDILRVELPAPPSGSARLELTVRPQDLDPMGHVNNAVYLDWIEEALTAAGLGDAVAAIPRRARLEYVASAPPDAAVTVTAWGEADRWWARIDRAGADLVRASGGVGDTRLSQPG